ncbi:MAG: TrmH family RNA methyltransferase [Clostridiales bacterium]|nr:TrmH family RNA methyltransferase [Clostridiales bacterium]
MVKKYKKTDRSSYTLGATVTMELLNKKPECARTVYISPKSDVAAVKNKANALGLNVVEGEKAFNILSPKENCFVIGEFDKFESTVVADRHHIVLVNPSNSGNLGTIIRDIAAFDCADLVIIKPAVDIFDPKTVRASMGAVFDINFQCFDSFDEYVESVGAGHEIVPFMLCGSPFGKKDFSGDKKYSLVFGNEATGLPQEFSKYNAVRIEQSNKVDSLNLSVATSIALYKLYVSGV